MTTPDPADLLALARAACDAADSLLVAGLARRHDEAWQVWSKSSATDLATEMDVAAERVVVETLLTARPFDVVLGEEGGVQRSGDLVAAETREDVVTWVVDPLDGTTNYVYALPHWAVSIAAQVNGVTVAGVVSVPMMGERFTAVAGGGAWLHDSGNAARRLVVAEPPTAAQALVATGFGYAEQRRREQGAVIASLLPAVRDIRRLGAAAIDLCHVACGRVDAYFERGLQPWDLAAGQLIAAEAGARVEGLEGALAGEEMVIAAAPGLFVELHDLISSASHGGEGLAP